MPIDSVHPFCPSLSLWPHVWQALTYTLYYWVCLFFLDSTWKWDHTTFVFLCVTDLVKHNALQSIYVITMARLISFWWLNSIPCVFACMCIYIKIPCIFICMCMVESSDKTWSTREDNGKPLSIVALRTTRTVWKSKKMGNWKMNYPGW